MSESRHAHFFICGLLMVLRISMVFGLPLGHGQSMVPRDEVICWHTKVLISTKIRGRFPPSRLYGSGVSLLAFHSSQNKLHLSTYELSNDNRARIRMP
jgi:hypothetical protein